MKTEREAGSSRVRGEAQKGKNWLSVSGSEKKKLSAPSGGGKGREGGHTRSHYGIYRARIKFLGGGRLKKEG